MNRDSEACPQDIGAKHTKKEEKKTGNLIQEREYLDKNGQIQTALLPTVKAHNLILDTTLSVGFLGLLSYLTLLIFCMW